MIVAIMQPTFMPWIGYFAMIDRVDQFVFFDDVQFSKRSWQQRNRIKTANGELMLTLPVLTKGKQDQEIRHVKLSPEHHSVSKLTATISQNYRKAPYFAEFFPEFQEILERETTSLCSLNVALIRWAMGIWGIPTKTLESSSVMGAGSKADLLADLCTKLGADRYLSAPGSKEYIDESSAFSERGIQVDYHQYEHPVYRQQWNGFLPYMAMIDLIFNEGNAGVNILRRGVRV